MFRSKQKIGALLPASLFMLLHGISPVLVAQAAKPDNSGTNKSQNQPVTAEQQKNDATGRNLTAKIRRAVIADKSLSKYAYNIKIIVVGGAVTLKRTRPF